LLILVDDLYNGRRTVAAAAVFLFQANKVTTMDTNHLGITEYAGKFKSEFFL